MIKQRLQYISSGNTVEAQYNNIFRALDQGVDWIQVRFKNAPISELLDLAAQIKILQTRYDFTLIVNDHVKIAYELDLDGVHLGLNDTSVPEARALIGTNKIIGGTANTLEDVQQRTLEKCNYIGLGPFRFTTSKHNLSPTLGLSGYKKILDNSPKEVPPIFAIGSVTARDIVSLRRIGLYGMAMSKEIESWFDEPDYVTTIKKLLYEKYA